MLDRDTLLTTVAKGFPKFQWFTLLREVLVQAGILAVHNWVWHQCFKVVQWLPAYELINLKSCRSHRENVCVLFKLLGIFCLAALPGGHANGWTWYSFYFSHSQRTSELIRSLISDGEQGPKANRGLFSLFLLFPLENCHQDAFGCNLCPQGIGSGRNWWLSGHTSVLNLCALSAIYASDMCIPDRS